MYHTSVPRMTTLFLCLHLILDYTLKFSSAVNGGHSLLAFATYIRGEAPFPTFGAALMLDDIQVGFYSSDEQKLLYRGPGTEDYSKESKLQKNAELIFSMMQEQNRLKLHRCIYHLNDTHRLPSLQTIFGCDMLDHNTPGRMTYNESFNGESGDQIYLSINNKAFDMIFRWTPIETKNMKNMVLDICQPICLSALHDLLKIHRNNVMRKVKPRVRLLQKALPDTGGVRVTCLATGFYPRHINLTLLRDGQPVAEHQISGGELLPNGDGSYQMRKSLEVSTEELQHHQYTCTAQHLSVDNKIDIPLEPRPRQSHAVLAVIVVLTLVCLLVFAIVTFMFCRKRLRGERKKTVRKDRKEEKQEEHAVPLKETTKMSCLPEDHIKLMSIPRHPQI